MHSIRQDFGGRFPQSLPDTGGNGGCSSYGGVVGDVVEEEEAPRDSILYDEDEDGSFDTNNLMPD